MRKTILSGMRPTGALHLGNLYGALKNWVRLQEDDSYERFYFVADWHALTTGFDASEDITENTLNMVIDWLAFGLDPDNNTIFVQSLVKEHAELFLLLSMITPVGWLERVPSYKDQIAQLGKAKTSNYGFLGYPVLMAADIIIYKAHLVPVGLDQVAHLEFARELVRHFNHLVKKDVFIEPQPLLTEVPKILGLDGRKMSKSYNNAIYLSDSEEETQKKIKVMFTDPRRKRKTDPGIAEECGVFMLHKIFTPKEKQEEIKLACSKAQIGCVECKKLLTKNVNEGLSEIRDKRNQLIKNKGKVKEILIEGSKKASRKAKETMEEVRDAIFSKARFG
ncbi:tryptophan--tRNA ligase [Hippea maritima]|uniref:Tryptophan--tRNA ligase n=1 Tax=Hippea maritima (strain ATCC 700847 / DSM 10411 / MH2) TaxID=760142 RepID=F2LV87_HIPMA|nr:tryptophan--tRNA ligase [Hippea maritima]AEA33671.1 tryptophanyl-tRNA synthetase [Hippea maritima DSM 10411]